MSSVSPRGFRIRSFGHGFFAATLVGLGIVGMIKGGFVPIWSGVPKTLSGRVVIAYLCALVSLGGGIGVVLQRSGAWASRVLVIYLIAWMLLFRVPLLFRAPLASEIWWAIGETAVMLAGAWVLLVWFDGDQERKRWSFATGANGLRVARALYGFGLIQFGIAHFTFLERTVSMVPGYLPWHLAWAYFTGGALIVAGAAIIIGLLARLAATLSALELTLFTVLVWGPVLVKGPDAGGWNEIIDSVALTAAAWLVADSYRVVARLAPGVARGIAA